MFRALAAFLNALGQVPGLAFLKDIASRISQHVSRAESAKNDWNRIKSTANDLKNSVTKKK